MAKRYFGESEEVLERLIDEFKEALREEGISTPGNVLLLLETVGFSPNLNMFQIIHISTGSS